MTKSSLWATTSYGKSNVFVLSLLLLLFWLSFNVDAQEVRFVTEEMSPFQIDEGEKLTGFAVEVVEQIKLKAGIKGRIEVYPWSRAYKMALSRPNTFIFTMVKTPERMTKFKWIGEYYTATDSFYALRSRRDIQIRSIADAKKYIICIPRNDVGEQHLEKMGFSDKSLKRVAFQAQCLGMLYRDRVDLNLFNHHGIENLAKKFDVDPLLFRRVLVVSKAVMGLAASKSTDDILVEKARQALREIKQSKSHQIRINQWFDSEKKNRGPADFSGIKVRPRTTEPE